MPVSPTPVETELKLELPSSDVSKLTRLAPLRHVRHEKPATEISVYFDTDKLDLQKRGVTLRVRRSGNRYVQTVKAAGDRLLDRDEWESEVKDGNLDLAAIRRTALEPLLTKKLYRKLRPVFETRVERTIFPLRFGESQLEVTLDRGKIDTGDHSRKLCEVEIELKAGERTELFKMADTLARATSAELGVKSKAERGYELLDGKDGAPYKAGSVVLTPETSTADAFRLIAASCLKQIAANKPAVLAEDPEGVHQMRIGLRRLRAAISLFSGILDAAESEPIKSELKWLADELGPVREFDVFLAHVVEQVRRHHPRLMGVRRLSRELVERRRAAAERACDAVQSARFRHLLFRLAAWLETGKWRDPDDELLRDRGRVPVAISAAEQLTRRLRKIRKKCKRLPELDPRARHRLRIQAKKLRYGATFFETVFAGQKPLGKSSRRRKAFLSTLEDVQDRLGDLNDIAAHENLTMKLARDAAPGTQGRERSQRVFAAGVLTGHEDARLNAALEAAHASCVKFAKTKPFWK
jgi:inorganic triphosphatase YgiF